MVDAMLKRGFPIKIIHIDVDAKRAEAFMERSKAIIEQNGWDEGVISVIEDPYRDLYSKVASTLKSLRTQYPEVYFEIYIGALRTHFPYSVLHMSTDRFLRDALMEADDVALNIKQVDIDALPLPPGFKVTFEHVHNHPQEEAVPEA